LFTVAPPKHYPNVIAIWINTRL